MPELFVFLIDVLSVAVFVTGDRCVKKKEKRKGKKKKKKKGEKEEERADCA